MTSIQRAAPATAEQIMRATFANLILAELVDTELAFLTVSNAKPPPLHTCRREPGLSAKTGMENLLSEIEASMFVEQLRSLLASCYEMDRQFSMHHLASLPPDHCDDLLHVFRWVNLVGPLRLQDFADSGARFLRLVMNKRPQTIARLVAGTAINRSISA